MSLDQYPLVSIVTPSLNGAVFLKDTIESIRAQSYPNIEHIVVDGGSTDSTIEILESYDDIVWISEPDTIVEAYNKGFDLASGKYIVQCCVSDGFLEKNWVQRAVDELENDRSISLVWALAQYMTEDGYLQNVWMSEFIKNPPPQKKDDFLIFFLATGFAFPEGNYCVKADIIKKIFPTNRSPEHYKIMSHLGFMYEFINRGYVSKFIPIVANFGRIHTNQRGQRLKKIEDQAACEYFKDIKKMYSFIGGGNGYRFVDQDNRVICDLRVNYFSLKYYKYKIIRSKLFNRTLFGVIGVISS